MKEYQRTGDAGRAALKASMDRTTAVRDLAAGHGPVVRQHGAPREAFFPQVRTGWAVPCRSESFLSLNAGAVAVRELGGVPEQVQTDQSSTATHPPRRSSPERGFNPKQVALWVHDKAEVDPST